MEMAPKVPYKDSLFMNSKHDTRRKAPEYTTGYDWMPKKEGMGNKESQHKQYPQK